MSVVSNNAPLVSVAMITYNHERFITKAIESVLAQRTSFPIELVIGDDASSDNTCQQIEVLKAQAPKLFVCYLVLPISECTEYRRCIGGMSWRVRCVS